MIYFPEFGIKLKKVRDRKDISQKELAISIGADQGTISRLENSDHDPDPKTLRRLIDFFHCEADELLFDKQEVVVDSITKDTALIMKDLSENSRLQIQDVVTGMKVRQEKEARMKMRLRA